MRGSSSSKGVAAELCVCAGFRAAVLLLLLSLLGLCVWCMGSCAGVPAAAAACHRTRITAVQGLCSSVEQLHAHPLSSACAAVWLTAAVAPAAASMSRAALAAASWAMCRTHRFHECTAYMLCVCYGASAACCWKSASALCDLCCMGWVGADWVGCRWPWVVRHSLGGLLCLLHSRCACRCLVCSMHSLCCWKAAAVSAVLPAVEVLAACCVGAQQAPLFNNMNR